MSDFEKQEQWRLALTVALMITTALIFSDIAEASVPMPDFCAQLEAWGWTYWQRVLVGCWW